MLWARVRQVQSAADGHENLPSWAPTVPLIDVEPGSQRVRLRARQSKFDAGGSSQDSEALTVRPTVIGIRAVKISR